MLHSKHSRKHMKNTVFHVSTIVGNLNTLFVYSRRVYNLHTWNSKDVWHIDATSSFARYNGSDQIKVKG